MNLLLAILQFCQSCVDGTNSIAPALGVAGGAGAALGAAASSSGSFGGAGGGDGGGGSNGGWGPGYSTVTGYQDGTTTSTTYDALNHPVQTVVKTASGYTETTRGDSFTISRGPVSTTYGDGHATTTYDDGTGHPLFEKTTDANGDTHIVSPNGRTDITHDDDGSTTRTTQNPYGTQTETRYSDGSSDSMSTHVDANGNRIVDRSDGTRSTTTPQGVTTTTSPDGTVTTRTPTTAGTVTTVERTDSTGVQHVTTTSPDGSTHSTQGDGRRVDVEVFGHPDGSRTVHLPTANPGVTEVVEEPAPSLHVAPAMHLRDLAVPAPHGTALPTGPTDANAVVPGQPMSVLQPDGNLVTFHADGTQLVHHPDGTWVHHGAQGPIASGHQPLPVAHPPATTVVHQADGTAAVTHPDGTRELWSDDRLLARFPPFQH